ncbi:DUF4232 domain-containing protein [Streptoalloteichus hindustanus]|uniref:DUF4232 domain-containing protein n=1 Tax=Streptoalloteichus hindustanus TaxID=2017 RepID=A0A1M4ZB10_STRHI|nr:DUF4232 domain-containing protein [Streptoalloteichus hindustanus]SHF15249.1 Protein of unknown function [Streptoalloteichus hindustanus]
MTSLHTRGRGTRLMSAVVPTALMLSALLAGCGGRAAAGSDGGIGRPSVTDPSGSAAVPTTRTSVQSLDLPSAAGTPVPASASCPKSGALVTAGQVEAALGHRASVLVVTNCGQQPYHLSGYPEVKVLDGEQKPLPVRVKRGSSYMASDPGPRDLTLSPGATARAVLSWSNTVTHGDIVNGSHVTVTLTPDRSSTTLPLSTDLGTTGQVTVTAWSTEPPR